MWEFDVESSLCGRFFPNDIISITAMKLDLVRAILRTKNLKKANRLGNLVTGFSPIYNDDEIVVTKCF